MDGGGSLFRRLTASDGGGVDALDHPHEEDHDPEADENLDEGEPGASAVWLT